MNALQQATTPVPDLESLRNDYIKACNAWLQAYSDAECLTDPQKRRVMFQARLSYQEAKMNYLFAERIGRAEWVS